MKKEEFNCLLKKGQKEFKEIDLEGDWINEDLQNLYFKSCFFEVDFTGSNLSKTTFVNCNLKCCIFKYSNLDQTIFEGNCLDSADFQFVQYNDITFNDNSSYGGTFTKEILEDLRFPNYPGFHIIKVYAGWFVIILTGKAKISITAASDYLGHNAPLELLKALNEICASRKDYIEKWLCWDEEPGAFIWRLTKQNNQLLIAVNLAKRYSSDIKDRDSLENEEILATMIEIEGEFLGFIREVIISFEKIRDAMGRTGYEKEWGMFPDDQLKKLKEFASSRKNRNLEK